MKISACVITKNEENNLSLCLESIQSVVSEIIVVDTGSTDGTLEVAEKYHAKIFNFDWVDDFSKARNYAISQATGDWIIFLDADERFSEKSSILIKKYIKLANKQKKDAIGCSMSNIDDDAEIINTFMAIRIFRRSSKIKYVGTIHEYLADKNGILQVLVAVDDLHIIHNGYSVKEVKRKNKGERNKELLFKELETNKNNSEIYFYLSEAYMIDRHFKEALQYAMKAKEVNHWKMYGLAQKNYLNISKLMRLQKFSSQEQTEIVEEALKDFPDFPDFNILYAELCLVEKRYEDAVLLLEHAKKNMSEALSSQSSSYLNLDKILSLIGDCYYKNNQLESSVKNYVESLKFNKYHLPSIISLLSILDKFDSARTIENFLKKIYDFSNLKDRLYLLNASLLASNAELAQIFFINLGEDNKDAIFDEEASLLLLSGSYEEAASKFKDLYNETNKEEYLAKSFVASLLIGGDYFNQMFKTTIPSLRRFGECLVGLDTEILELDHQSILNVISELIRISQTDIVMSILLKIEKNKVCFQIAEILYNKEKYDVAIEFYNKYLEYEVNIPLETISIIFVKMAECLFHLEQLQLAQQFLKDAININSKYYQIYELGIKISEKLNDKENVYSFCEGGLKEYPNSYYLRMIRKRFPDNIETMNELINKIKQIEFDERIKRLTYVNKQETRKLIDSQNENKPLHIVYVLNHVGICGGVKVIFEHANGLEKLGNKVTLVSHYPKPNWFPIDVDYIQVPFQVELSKGIPNCDVIVATYWEHISACVETGIAQVVYFEQGDFHLFEWEKLSNDFKKIVNKQYQLPIEIIAVSGQIAKLIKKNFNRDSYVCPNALNENIFYPKNKREDKKYMIIVGSEQTAFKGISDLKSAFKILLSKGYDLELIWITAQPPINPLGEVYVSPTQEKIGELYRKAAVYVSGSHYESFPLPPLEAMSCGTPVVTTDNVGIKEYGINGINCLMAKIGDANGLANQIMKLLDNHELYDRLVNAGLETSEKFHWMGILNKLKHYYTGISENMFVYQNKQEDWIKFYNNDDFYNKNDVELVDKFLATSNANEVLFPVVYDKIANYSIIRWEPLARRKVFTKNNYSERIFLKIYSKQIPNDWLYKDVYILISEGEYQKALSELNLIINELQAGSIEEAVCIRWIVLCLIKMEMYNQALELIEDVKKLHPIYTDYIYLESVINRNIGNEGISNLYLYCWNILNESAFYPEYIDAHTFS